MFIESKKCHAISRLETPVELGPKILYAKLTSQASALTRLPRRRPIRVDSLPNFCPSSSALRNHRGDCASTNCETDEGFLSMNRVNEGVNAAPAVFTVVSDMYLTATTGAQLFWHGNCLCYFPRAV